jgi:hypothetical protein
MTMLLERPYHGRGFWSAALLLISLTLVAPAYAVPPLAPIPRLGVVTRLATKHGLRGFGLIRRAVV